MQTVPQLSGFGPAVFRGRMLVDEQQQLALVHDAAAIQVKGRDGRAANGCEADQQSEIIAPREMLVPVVLARMKKRDNSLGEQVNGSGLVVLDIVAALAGAREVVGYAFAARCARDDVFVRETIRAVGFLANVILAAALRAFADERL